MQSLDEYNEYFDACERANKKPLTYGAWCADHTVKQSPASRAGFSDALFNRPFNPPQGYYSREEYEKAYNKGKETGLVALQSVKGG